MAALLTSTWRPPSKERAVFSIRSTSFSSDTSAEQVFTEPSGRDFATSSSISRRRPAIHTRAPQATKRRVMAAPMPVPPPVTIATFPFRSTALPPEVCAFTRECPVFPKASVLRYYSENAASI